MRRGLLLLAGSLIAAAAHASRLDKRAFTIAAGPAPETLATFVQQSGFQVLFDFDAIRGFNTHEVRGLLEPAEALARMLEGSRLMFEFVNERTVAVRPRPPPRPAPAAEPDPAS
jgi:hypothetical protein